MATSRSSSAQYVTPRGNSAEDIEGHNFLNHFSSRHSLQMDAPKQQHQDSQEHHWVDQQQWEQEQEQQRLLLQQQMQQKQQQQGAPEGQQQQGAGGAEGEYLAPLDTEKLNQAVLQHLWQQQQQQQPSEDLNKMVGEGEWESPRKGASWVYTRAMSDYTGFMQMPAADSEEPPEKQRSGLQAINSGIYVPGVKQWNAATNTPVLPMGEETQKLESRKFTYDSRTGEYVNAHDERDRIPREQLQELSRALSTAAVKETVVDIMQRRATLRKMSKASRLFLQCNKKNLSTLSSSQGRLPPVVMAYLPDRYIKTYDRTNCMGQRISTRRHESSSCCS